MSTGRRNNVTIKGLDELARKLKALPEVVDRAGARAVKAETDETADDMRRGAPFKTGELRESIGSEYNAKTMTGRASATAKHADFVEHGTSDTPAQPFVEPAAARARRRFPDRVKTEIKRELGKL
jgi:HK97 gp10 family phage protein